MKTMKLTASKVAELAAQRDPWEAPAYLTADERSIWDETVSAMGADHFQQGDLRTLADWCRGQSRLHDLIVAQRRMPILSKDKDKREQARGLAREISAVRISMISITRMLRLAPSTRTDRHRNSGMPTRNPSRAARAGRGHDTNDLLP